MLSQKSSEWSSLSSGREILQELYHKEAGVFWARECTFSYQVAILDLAQALEGWGDGKLAEVVGAKWRASTDQEFNYNPKCGIENLPRQKIRRLDKEYQKLSTLNIPLFLTATGQRTFQYRATSLWNELQPTLKVSPSLTQAKAF